MIVLQQVVRKKIKNFSCQAQKRCYNNTMSRKIPAAYKTESPLFSRKFSIMAKTEKTVNYTPEQTAELVAAYVADATEATIATFAEKFGKTARSIIAKLSREGVYKKKEYQTKTGEAVQKKNELADAIGAVLKMTEPEITSMEKVNKTALQKIFTALAN